MRPISSAIGIPRDVMLHLTASLGQRAPLRISVPHRNHSEGAFRGPTRRSENLRQASNDGSHPPATHGRIVGYSLK
jgi:hypothetical protein